MNKECRCECDDDKGDNDFESEDDLDGIDDEVEHWLRILQLLVRVMSPRSWLALLQS